MQKGKKRERNQFRPYLRAEEALLSVVSNGVVANGWVAIGVGISTRVIGFWRGKQIVSTIDQVWKAANTYRVGWCRCTGPMLLKGPE